jgi:ribosomal protein S20
MANHQSSKKRIRQDEKKRLDNKYYAKTVRNAVKKFRATTDKEEAVTALPQITSLIDKLAKKNVIHKNKAANLKSSITLHAGKL